jgi:hypothetical protein
MVHLKGPSTDIQIKLNPPPTHTQRKPYIYIYIVVQCLRYCATNRKVAGSIPDGVIGIFHSRNPSDRIIALGSTQPLIEMSTRNISWR